ncbi:MAG: phosphopentomutase, partial [Chthoniobacterales bacterium]
ADLVMITADHGNDPTWAGTDHTRERVPVFVLFGGVGGSLGERETFGDVAATLAEFFEVAGDGVIGESLLPGGG